MIKATGNGIPMRYWLVAFAIIVQLPLLAFLVYSSYDQHLQNTEEIDASIHRRAQMVAQTVEERLSQIEYVAFAIAQSPQAQKGDIRGLYEYARSIQEALPSIFTFALLDSSGRFLFSTRSPYGETIGALPDAGVLRQVIATGKNALSDLYVTPKTKTMVVALNVPIFRQGKTAYVLRAVLTTKSLDEMLGQQIMRKGAVAVVTDSKGIRVARTPLDETLTGKPVSPRILAALQKGEKGVFSTQMLATSEESRAVVMPVSGRTWHVVVNIPTASLYDVILEHRTNIVALLGSILCITLAFSFLLARQAEREFKFAMSRRSVLKITNSEPQHTSLIAEANELTDAMHQAGEWGAMVTVLDNTESAVVITDIQGRIEWCNPAFQTLTGYSPEESLGKTPGQLVKSGSHDEAHYRDLWATITSGRTWRGEFTNRRKNGSLYTEYQTISPLSDETGKIQRYVAIKVDITELKAMQLELTRRAEQLNTFIECAPTAIAMLDRQMRYLAVSRRWRQDHDLLDRPLIGHDHYDLFPFMPERWKNANQRALGGETVNCDEDHVLLPDGSDQWLRWEVRPWQETNGDVGGIVIYYEDITERKKGQIAVAESETRMRSLFENSLDAILLTVPDGRILMANKVAQTMFGYSEEELIASGRSAITFDDDPQLVAAMTQRERTGSFRGELTFKCKDGKPLDAEVSSQIFTSQDGMRRAALFIRDITPLRQALAAVTEYKHVVDYAPMPLLLVDKDFRFVVENPFHAAMLGKAPEEIVGKLGSEILPPDLYARVEPHLKRCAAGEPQQYMLEQEYPDGKRYAFEVRLNPYRVGDDVQGVVVTMNDVTDLVGTRIKLEQTLEDLEVHRVHLEHLVNARTAALLASEVRTREIIDSTADGLIGVDGEGNITFCNPAALALLGYEADKELAGRSLHDTVHYSKSDCRVLPGTGCAMMQAIRSGSDLRSDTEVFWRADGSILPVRIAMHPMEIPGQPAGTVISFSDNTERERIAGEREAARQAAERHSQFKSDFLANMSHEIRTPLNAIVGLSHLVFNDARDARQRERLQKIVNSSEHLLALINDILDLSKIEAGQLRLEAIDFSVRRIVDDAVNLVAEKSKQKGLALTVQIAPDIPAASQSDPTRLQQVLLNYLGNAIKFTELGTIRVSASIVARENNRVRLRLEVTDTGPGIAEEIQTRLFQPFEQGDSAVARLHGGTGLGLVICKRIAELMEGAVGVQSTLGIGSSFWFEGWLNEAQKTLAIQPSALKKSRILLVGSPGDICARLAEQAKSLDISINPAGNLREAAVRLETAIKMNMSYRFVIFADTLEKLTEECTEDIARRFNQAANEHKPFYILVANLRSKTAARLNDLRIGFDHIMGEPLTAHDLERNLLEATTALALQQDSAGLSQTDPLPQQRFAGSRVLLVEDNQVNQFVATDILSTFGIIPDIAENGKIAVEKIQEKSYELVLMDMQMPVMNGVDATRIIRGLPNRENVPILAMTANAFESDRERCLAAGMNDHLAKPVTPAALYAALGKWLTAKAAAKADAPLAGANDPASGLLARLGNISGLNVTFGLRQVRENAETYGKMLSLFIDTQASKGAQLESLLAARNYSDIRKVAHSIKGSASTIGAMALSNLAARLDEAVRSGMADDEIDSRCRSLVRSLSSFEREASAEISKARHVSFE